jgi:hypothetical protein
LAVPQKCCTALSSHPARAKDLSIQVTKSVFPVRLDPAQRPDQAQRRSFGGRILLNPEAAVPLCDRGHTAVTDKPFDLAALMAD